MLNPVNKNPDQRSKSAVPWLTTRREGDEVNIGRRLRSNVVWAGAGRLLSVVFLFGFHTLLARQMSASDYGHYVLLESLMLVTSILMLAGLPSVSLRLIRADIAMGKEAAVRDTVRTSLVMLAGTSLVAMLGVTSLAFFTRHHLFGGALWGNLGWILIWSCCASLLRLISELARGCQMLGFSYLIGGQSGGFGVNGMLLSASMVVGLLLGLSLGVVLRVQIAVQGLCVVCAVFLILQATDTAGFSADSGATKEKVKRYLQSTFPLLIQQLVAFGLPEVDTMLLGAHASGEEIAVYGTAKKLVFLGAVPLLLVNHAVQPFIVDFHSRGNSSRLTTLVRGAATLAGIPSLLVLLILCVFPEFILGGLFGAAYTTAAMPLRILCAGAAGFVLTGSCGLVLIMTGHERTAMWSSVIIAGAYLVVAPMFVEKYGVIGAALATSALQISSNLIAMLLVFRCERVWTGFTFSRRMTQDCLRMFLSRREQRG